MDLIGCVFIDFGFVDIWWVLKCNVIVFGFNVGFFEFVLMFIIEVFLF